MDLLKTADYWIDKLELLPHPEGGYYKEVYRSEEKIFSLGLPSRYKTPRAFSTSIYYMLKEEQVSKFHRLKSDEIWHFYYGSSLTIHLIDKTGNLIKHHLGIQMDDIHLPQVHIKRGNWFAAEVDDKSSYSLIGCTVAPGFEFSDFEIAKKDKLIKTYSDYKDVIEKFTG
jgi:hypothetical protein